MSEARKAELQADFEEKVRQLQALQEKFGPEGELMRKNIELSEPIFKKINDALKALAEEESMISFLMRPPRAVGSFSPERTTT